jgi:hypothetical protein
VKRPAAPNTRLGAARRLIDDREGARLLGVSRSMFRYWVSIGAIPRVRVPGTDGRELRRLLVEEADVIAFIDRYKEK